MNATDPPPPRLAPERPLPPYSYVNGLFPHPVSDPAGHMAGQPVEEPRTAPPEDWRTWADYLFGFDLFNRGYYWEAHELWERAWIACGRRGADADLCKALIKLAAACVKAREGRPDGVERHARRALELLETLAAGDPNACRLGVDLAAAAQLAGRLAAEPGRWVNVSAEPVVRIGGFALWPELS